MAERGELQTRVRLADTVTLVFAWQGGRYVDVYRTAGRRPVGGHTPVDAIHVWDDQAGRARIPFTQKALNAAVHEWIVGYGGATAAPDGRAALLRALDPGVIEQDHDLELDV
jgi:hypothetical protein